MIAAAAVVLKESKSFLVVWQFGTTYAEEVFAKRGISVRQKVYRFTDHMEFDIFVPMTVYSRFSSWLDAWYTETLVYKVYTLVVWSGSGLDIFGQKPSFWKLSKKKVSWNFFVGKSSGFYNFWTFHNKSLVKLFFCILTGNNQEKKMRFQDFPEKHVLFGPYFFINSTVRLLLNWKK